MSANATRIENDPSAPANAQAQTGQRPSEPAIGSHSPCLGVCELDAASGWCAGCGRTGTEIADWQNACDETRQQVWSLIPDRLAALGAERRILPWSPEGCLDAALALTRGRNGYWLIAPEDGTPAAFPTGPGIDLSAARALGQVVIRSPFGSFGLKSHDKLRAFGFGPIREPAAYIFAIPSGRATVPARERDEGPTGTLRIVETTLAQIGQNASEREKAQAASLIADRPFDQFELPGWAAVMTAFIAT